MSVLSDDPVTQDDLFECLPRTLGFVQIKKPEYLREDFAEYWRAPGAELVGLNIVIWRYIPGRTALSGYIMDTRRTDKSYDPTWDLEQEQDFFSSFQHCDEILCRHTKGMLNINRLQNLNRIWKEITKPE